MGGPKNYKRAAFKSLVLVAVLVAVTVVAMPPSRAPGIQGAQIGPAVITSDHVDYDASLPPGQPGKQRASVTPATIATVPVGDNPVRISGSILAAVAVTVKSEQKISDTAGGFTGVLGSGDGFGRATANLGDLDGDAVSDLAVGANLDDDGGTDRGAVWVLFMNADGTVKSHQKISDTDGGFTGGLRNGNHFGESTASLGDLNGDGVSDLAVGTSGDGVFNRGAVWVLFMNADGTVKSHQKISDTAGGFTGVLDDRDFFGTAVASLGDLDGDGVSDLAVGAILDDDDGTDRGAVWVLFMNADGTVKSHQKISDTAGGFAGVLDDLDEFGGALANLGDLDGDGVSDLAVGVRFDDDGGNSIGAVWVLFLNADGTVKSEQKISATAGGFTGILDAEDHFGISTTSLGDLDGDGVPDLAVGAYLDDDGGTARGAVWVLFMNADGTVKSHLKISDTAGGFTGVLDNSDWFGFSVAGLGDLDGDGVSDLAVGALSDDDGGTNTGAVWVLFFLNAVCTLPDSGDWMVTESCVLAGSATAPGNVIVEQNIALIIAENASLDIDFTNFHLKIKNGAKVVIKSGGKIF